MRLQRLLFIYRRKKRNAQKIGEGNWKAANMEKMEKKHCE